MNAPQKQFEAELKQSDVLTTNISVYLQPQRCMRRRFNTEWSGNGKRGGKKKKLLVIVNESALSRCLLLSSKFNQESRRR